jgi:hypothetical protein
MQNKPAEPTGVIITRIRQEIGRGSVPTADVLRLCERSEELLAVALRMEGALHDALKIIESRK